MNAIDRMKRYTEIASRAGSGATEVDYVTIRDVLDELDRLRAIVDRLPKTADGVPIYPGMTVWALIPGLEISDATETGRLPDGGKATITLRDRILREDWPTATARDYRSPCASEATHEKNSRPLSEVVGQHDQASPSTPGKPRGSLNSAWVAQLMSWPDEYMNALTELVTEYHLTKPRPQRTKACSE